LLPPIPTFALCFSDSIYLSAPGCRSEFGLLNFICLRQAFDCFAASLRSKRSRTKTCSGFWPPTSSNFCSGCNLLAARMRKSFLYGNASYAGYFNLQLIIFITSRHSMVYITFGISMPQALKSTFFRSCLHITLRLRGVFPASYNFGEHHKMFCFPLISTLPRRTEVCLGDHCLGDLLIF